MGGRDPLFLGPPVVPFYQLFGWEGSPTTIDYRNKYGTLILTSLLEDLVLCLVLAHFERVKGAPGVRADGVEPWKTPPRRAVERRRKREAAWKVPSWLDSSS